MVGWVGEIKIWTDSSCQWYLLYADVNLISLHRTIVNRHETMRYVWYINTLPPLYEHLRVLASGASVCVLSIDRVAVTSRDWRQVLMNKIGPQSPTKKKKKKKERENVNKR